MRRLESGDDLNFVANHKVSGAEYLACGAHGKQKGTRCLNDAGKGTDHLGLGRCKFHGGKNQSPTSQNFKHGLHAKIHYGDVVERIEKLKAARDVFDMRDHIFLLEAIGQEILENAEQIEDLYPLVKVVDTVTKSIQRLHEVEVGRRYVISVENIGSLIDKIGLVIERHVTDPYTRSLIAEDLMKVYKTPHSSLLIEGKTLELANT